jgi:hypothetical protein
MTRAHNLVSCAHHFIILCADSVTRVHEIKRTNLCHLRATVVFSLNFKVIYLETLHTLAHIIIDLPLLCPVYD